MGYFVIMEFEPHCVFIIHDLGGRATVLKQYFFGCQASEGANICSSNYRFQVK